VDVLALRADPKAVLKHLRPDAILGLFGVPWRPADHDGAILKIVGQDYNALGEHVDVFSPMVYHMMCGRPLSWIGEVVEEVHNVVEEVHNLTGKPVWPIIQSVDQPSAPLSAEEYGQALDIALSGPASEGVLVFQMESALDEAKLEVTKSRFGS